jgi:16S rRNA (cytidine1402-2'-O)-methyltransferase
VSDTVGTPPHRGRLVLVPNTLDHGTETPVPLDHVLPRGLIERAAGLRHWAVENARSARAFLKRVDAVCTLAAPLQSLDIRELPRPRKGAPADDAALRAALDALLSAAEAGHDIGLLSEAGLPAVADPGHGLVWAAHTRGLAVEPWSGPSSLMLALAASGLGGQHFAFVGYLPQEAAARTTRIRELETLSRRAGQTQLAIETPYRNGALLQALLATLQPTTRLCVAAGVTLAAPWVVSDTVRGWRERQSRGATAGLDDRTPAVFGWLA